MAWRPYENLIEGELDNTSPGKVTGWIRFFRQGLEPLEVTLDLVGDCHRDLQGRRFRIINSEPAERFPDAGRSYMEHFHRKQTGSVGDITAGDPPRDYSDYPYIEWYSEQNGRVVLELGRDQLEILTDKPAFQAGIPDRGKQHENMAGYLTDMAKATGAQIVGVVGDAPRQKSTSKGK